MHRFSKNIDEMHLVFYIIENQIIINYKKDKKHYFFDEMQNFR